MPLQCHTSTVNTSTLASGYCHTYGIPSNKMDSRRGTAANTATINTAVLVPTCHESAECMCSAKRLRTERGEVLWGCGIT
jgi:hypothetical protein